MRDVMGAINHRLAGVKLVQCWRSGKEDQWEKVIRENCA
jgi:hypothetical protein